MADDSPTESPLHTAARCGQIEEIRKLLKSKQFNVNSLNFDKRTPLHLACINGHLDLVDALVSEFNADIGAPDKENNTPLLVAAHNGHIQIVFMLTLISMYGRMTSNGDRLPVCYTPCNVEGNHKILEDLVLKCYDRKTKEETTQLLLTKFKDVIVNTGDQNYFPLFLAAVFGLGDAIDALIGDIESNANLGIKYSLINNLTILHAACVGSHSELVESLISKHNLDPNAKDDDGNTPLHIAAIVGSEETVRFLATKYDAALVSSNHENDTPLHVAALNGRMAVVDILIEEFGCDPNIKGFEGRTLLHQACIGNNTELVENLLFEHNLDPMAEDDNGDTPLHIAAMVGAEETVRFFATKDDPAFVSRNKQNNTPLHVAAINERLDVVHILIGEFSCNPNVKGFEGRTLLHQACIGSNTELVENLISKHNLDPMAKDDDGDTPLHFAAIFGAEETVRFLATKYDVALVSRNHQNNTPLHVAAVNGKLGVVHILIDEFSCNPNIIGFQGRTLLHYAYIGSNTELVENLISKHNLDPMAEDEDGDTPLHIAAMVGAEETVRFLAKKYDAALVSRNHQNNTPLHVAAVKGRLDIVHILIGKFSCDSNVKGFEGRTLLHQACNGGNAELLKRLISRHNISVLSTDDEGNTPLHLAALYGRDKCIHKLLYEFKAPLFVRNKAGKTAFDIARSSSQSKTAVSEFIKYKQLYGSTIQAEYDQMYQLSQKQFAGKKHLARLFVVGHPEAGKSTLIETMKTEGYFEYFKYLLSIASSSVLPHTAGIVPSVHDSYQYGRILFYDFAGDPEYYSSHSAILENLNSSEGVDIFFVVIDLSKSDSLIRTRFGYWLSFITHNLKGTTSTVIPIGSYADMLNSLRTTETHKLEVIDRVSRSFSYKELKVEAGIALDCRKPKKVIYQLKAKVQEVSRRAPPVELSLEASTLFGLLLKDFANVTACKCQQLISHVKQTGLPLPVDAKQLYSIVKQLHNLGLLLVIEKEGDPIKNHLLVLNMSTLTSEVHKKLFSKFASDQLSLHTDPLQLSVGIIPETLLDKILPEYITKECLLQLQYCQGIENVNVEKDHTLTQSTKTHSGQLDPAPTTKSLLFFPALCQLKREDVSWATAPSKGYALGWYAKCKQKFDYFPSRFFHVLTIRLALTFALRQCLPSSNDSLIVTELHRTNPRCHVWKTGLHWLMENGVEVFVDMIKEAENRELVVIARSADNCTVECASTFQKVIQTVIEAKVEFCHSINPSIYLLDPEELKEQTLPNIQSLHLYNLKEVGNVLATGKKQAVSVDGRRFLSSERLSNLAQCTYWSKLCKYCFYCIYI